MILLYATESDLTSYSIPVFGSCHQGDTKTFGYSLFLKANNIAKSVNAKKFVLREAVTALYIVLV